MLRLAKNGDIENDIEINGTSYNPYLKKTPLNTTAGIFSYMGGTAAFHENPYNYPPPPPAFGYPSAPPLHENSENGYDPINSEGRIFGIGNM